MITNKVVKVMHVVSATRLLRERDGGSMKLGVIPGGGGAAPNMVALSRVGRIG